jgi:hypothetical protein
VDTLTPNKAPAEQDIPVETAEALIEFSDRMTTFGADAPELEEWLAQHQHLPHLRELAEESRRLERLFRRPSAATTSSLPSVAATPPKFPDGEVEPAPRAPRVKASGPRGPRLALFFCLLLLLGLGGIVVMVAGTFQNARPPTDDLKTASPDTELRALREKQEKLSAEVTGLKDKLRQAQRTAQQATQQRGEATKAVLVLWDGLKTNPEAWKDPRLKALCGAAEKGLVAWYREDANDVLDLALQKKNPTEVRKASFHFIAVHGSGATAETKKRFVPALESLIANMAVDEPLRQHAEKALAGLRE